MLFAQIYFQCTCNEILQQLEISSNDPVNFQLHYLVEISDWRIKYHAEWTIILECSKLGENLESTSFFDINHLHLKLSESLNLESTLQHFLSLLRSIRWGTNPKQTQRSLERDHSKLGY